MAESVAGGSRLDVEWSCTDVTRMRRKIALPLIQRFPMSRLISRMWISALDRYAASPKSGG